MAQRSDLGPFLRRYRTRVSAPGALGWLSLGPAIIVITVVIAGALERPELLLVVLVGAVITAVMGGYLLWSGSAHLDVHAGGVVVGRSVLAGRPREIRFTEIHPATLRLHSRAGNLLPTWQRRFQRSTSARLYLAPGADRAVSFLGPDLDTELSATVRPPVHGRGIVVFASPVAEEIADQIRAGLERAGCPPPLSREYLRHGVNALPGNGFDAEQTIPGMEHRRAR